MKTETTHLFFSAAGARSQLIGFLDDPFTLRRPICVPLSSLSRGESWSSSLVLARSRGLYLWWRINWAVPLKKTVQTLLCRAMKIGFVWLESSGLFIYMSECFEWRLARSLHAFVSLCPHLHACMLRVLPSVHTSCVVHVCMWKIKT